MDGGSFKVTDASTTVLSLCILCQKEKRGEKLTSTENGRSKLQEASQNLEDKLLSHIEEDKYEYITYHLTCFKPYILRAERNEKRKENPIDENRDVEPDEESCVASLTSPRSKRRRSQETEFCIICNSERTKKGTFDPLYRMCEPPRAKIFLSAIRYNMDDVYTRCSTYKTLEHIFAADIVSHRNCMKLYLLKYQRKMEEIMNYDCSIDSHTDVTVAFNSTLSKIDLAHNAYTISTLRDMLNSELGDEFIDNRAVKKLLINHFGEDICFTYPNNPFKSQIIFLKNITISDVVQKVIDQDAIKECASILKAECSNYDFELDRSFCNADDLRTSNKKERPKSWEMFFNVLFPNRYNSEAIKRKCDTIFQTAYYGIHNGKKKTPMHVSITNTVHDLTRSKQLIEILNRLGLGISFRELERIDNALARRTIERASEHRVPIPPSIKGNDVIHGAMDNFDHEENTKSGKGGSHDTILVLFENNKEEDSTQEEHIISKNYFDDQLPFNHVLKCQILVTGHKFGVRGEIPSNFKTGVAVDTVSTENLAERRFKAWLLARSSTLKEDKQNVPSFSAMNSLLHEGKHFLTKIAFTPIIPYPATDYDTIFTCMRNFQDVLEQKCHKYGPLWCDEGVYHIAKELQLLYPKEFSNIFLGLGGFHMEKIVLTCLGKYLEEIGIDRVLVKNEAFGPGTVKQVMTGGHYVRSKRGMTIIAEALYRLYFCAFRLRREDTNYKELLDEISNIQGDLDEDGERDDTLIQYRWKGIECRIQTIEDDFKLFNAKESIDNCGFAYWVQFLFELYPVIRDLTRSHREGDWTLHLSAVRRALPLFFAFDRTNYARWAPLYYEDCIRLKEEFPLLQSNFEEAGFVVKHTQRKGSGMPMDQALEKAYNKVSKGPGGVIGITRNKAAVAKWNLIKHEKMLVTQYLRDVCELDNDDETTLHHEFSPKTTIADEEIVSDVAKCIEERFNPFKHNGGGKILNIITGKELDSNTSELLLNCVKRGKQAYDEYKKSRFEEKTKKLFDTMPLLNKSLKSVPAKPKYDIKKETIAATRNIDYARLRQYDMSSLLKYELTSIPFFLTKDGFLKKPEKYKLSKEIREGISRYKPPVSPPQEINHCTMTVIDFMAFARKVALKKLNIVTFEEFARNLWQTFLSIAKDSQRIDVIFDLYFENSIKSLERKRRAETSGYVTNIGRGDQPVPAEMNYFWSMAENKTNFQQFFVKWLIKNYDTDKTVYLGGGHSGDPFKCISLTAQGCANVDRLSCKHEEADDRLFFHINQGIISDRVTKVNVGTVDTDILVNLCYHFSHWSYNNLKELWMIMRKDERIPVHHVVHTMNSNVLDVLPAIHALTGSDTTSKVGTKKEGLNTALTEHRNIMAFGKEQYSEEMMFNAEKYLVSCLSKKKEKDFDQLRFNKFHTKTFKMEFDKLPCTSESMHQHIARAYLQCYRWINCPFNKEIALDPRNFGYIILNGDLVPDILVNTIIPPDFPIPCECGKCARQNICVCRIKNIPCCKFCNCCANESCKNPY